MKTQENEWKEIMQEVMKNIAYITTRRQEMKEDTSRYARLMTVDGDECLLKRFYADALTEVDRVLSIPYTADVRQQALIHMEVKRYATAYVTARWLHTVAPEEAGFYEVLSARLLDHVSELAYRRRSNRPTRRRMQPF